MIKSIFGIAIFISLGSGSLFASPALAQVSFGNDGPIDIKAERASYRGTVTLLSGDVKVKQKGATIFADKMDLFRAETESQLNEQGDASIKFGNINLIVAVGNFKYTTPENHVTGDKGVYERDKEIITVTGNAKFVQNNGNTVTGNKMIYDLNTNQARIAGNCTGRNCNDNDRVEINIGGKK